MFSNTSQSFVLNQLHPRRRCHFITVVILGCIILIFALAYAAYGREPSPDSTLLQIHVLFRHGERTPTQLYPTDPHKDYPWPGGLGSLTNKGKLRMYNIGKWFRKKYGAFLGELFDSEEITIRSSSSARCQMSGMTLLAGLFPPVGPQLWSEELLWQPILVNPIPRAEDNLLACKAPCPAFDVEKEKSDDLLHANLSQTDKQLFSYLSQHIGSFVNNIESVEFLYSTLKIETEEGLSLPDWSKSVYPEPMRRLAALNLASYTWTPRLKRLRAGPLLKLFLENMKKSSSEEKKKTKAYFYSGHDITLVNLLRTLTGAESSSQSLLLPDYGATLVLELHLVNAVKIVQAVYYKDGQGEGENLLLKGCEASCRLESLEVELSPYLPADWSAECKTTPL